jgi:hypothetical protein
MKLNLNELTLTSFNSIYINLTEYSAVNNLVAMATMENKKLQTHSLVRFTS